MTKLFVLVIALLGSLLMASPTFAQEGTPLTVSIKAKISHVDITVKIEELAKIYPEQSKILHRIADIHAQLGLLFNNQFKYSPARFYAELCNQLEVLEVTTFLLQDTPAFAECKKLLNHRYYFVPNGEKFISLKEAAELVEENISDFKYGFAQIPWGNFYNSFDGGNNL